MTNIPRIHPESRKLKTSFSASLRDRTTPLWILKREAPQPLERACTVDIFFVDSGFVFWYRKKQRNRSVISDLNNATKQNHMTTNRIIVSVRVAPLVPAPLWDTCLLFLF